MLSREGGVAIEGYEMLKGLEGVSTHEHSEWLPVIENSQDMRSLAQSVEAVLGEHPERTGFCCAVTGFTHGAAILPKPNGT